MGIKDLTMFLIENAPEAISYTTLDKFSNKTVAIDVSIFLYKFKYKGNKILYKILEQINRLRLHNITPVYIFDGKPTYHKQNVLNERKEIKINNINKLSELQTKLAELSSINKNNKDDSNNRNIEILKRDIEKLSNKVISVTKEDIINLKLFLNIIHIPYLQAEGEADFLCSKLCEMGIVDMVISEDMDLLTSATKILLRNFNINSNKIVSYNLQIILNKLNLSYEKWVELCILFGCDYLKRIRGIGPKCSYKYVSNNINKEFKEILNEIEINKKCNIPDNYLDNFHKSKLLFMNIDINYLNFKSNEDLNNFININPLNGQNKDIISLYLSKNTHLSDNQIKNRIKNIYK